jgi:RNA recognition motif-containing protein
MCTVVAEKVTDTIVIASLSNTFTREEPGKNDASVAEGRRLIIGNLAYAATEKELTEFFKGYLV